MKDPAIVFYTSDFMVGVASLTMKERGQYITLLCLEHQLGRLSKKIIDLNIKDISEDVLKKFIIDENGNYYNKRLEYEIEKRTKFKEHQRENGKKGGRPKTQIKPKKNPNETQTQTQMKAKKKPLENENENENNIYTHNYIINSTNIDNNNKYNVVNDIVAYLNDKTGTHYKSTTKATITKIKARLNEGFNVDDFKIVIDKKTNEWLGTDWEKFLRPDTLFGTKFEQYLNQTKYDKIEKPKTQQQKNLEFLNRMMEELDEEE